MYDITIVRKVRHALNAADTETEAYTRFEEAGELLHQTTTTDHELLQQRIFYSVFDRSEEYAAVAADQCYEGIEAFCGVKIFTHQRRETTLFGEKKVRLMAILGTKSDSQFARWLYNMIDDTIEHESENYQTHHKGKLHDKDIPGFQNGLAVRINTRLKQLAEAQRSKGAAFAETKEHMLVEAAQSRGLMHAEQKVIKA
jgi:hypothetical protein